MKKKIQFDSLSESIYHHVREGQKEEKKLMTRILRVKNVRTNVLEVKKKTETKR